MSKMSVLSAVMLAVALMAGAAHSAEYDNTVAECKTVAEVASAEPELSTLVAAVEAANLTSLLSNPELDATVFAPTNEAFENLLEALGLTATELLADVETLTKVLSHHVVDSAVLSGNLTDGMSFATLEESFLTVDLTDGVVITTEMGGNATVIIPDIEACNAVIHVIDAVLVPDMSDAALVTDESA